LHMEGEIKIGDEVLKSPVDFLATDSARISGKLHAQGAQEVRRTALFGDSADLAKIKKMRSEMRQHYDWMKSHNIELDRANYNAVFEYSGPKKLNADELKPFSDLFAQDGYEFGEPEFVYLGAA